MSGRRVFNKLRRKVVFVIVIPLLNKIRIYKYKLMSTCLTVSGRPKLIQPMLLLGPGNIKFNEGVHIGFYPSPAFYSTYAHLEVRKAKSKIEIGRNVWVNNNAAMISEGEGIFIGDNTLIGVNFCAMDSDFHDLNPEKRMNGEAKTGAIRIEANVFIGSNVTILKGVSIGENSVIASGSVVTRSIPGNTIAGGNPCKIIKDLNG
jgi:acetyltransferase-like isoleucine patch superfamily enzyme